MQPPPLRPLREHPRVSAGFPVQVKLGESYLSARARDFSMTGIFLEQALPFEDEVQVRIPLPGLPRPVETTCRVERRAPDGVALSFAQVEWDDLLLMARYLAPRL
ncbi:MAG: PilZ domain-containing protein [Myxococcales bacterium]|jgi:hypothetical protein